MKTKREPKKAQQNRCNNYMHLCLIVDETKEEKKQQL